MHHDLSKPHVILAWKSKDIVGESLVWDERTGSLIWIDILGKRIHQLHWDDQTHNVWPTPDFVTGLGLCNDRGMVVSLMKEICLWNCSSHWEPLARIEPDRPDNRLNECGIAPDGTFWVGTMRNNFDSTGQPIETGEPAGTYYRVDPAGTVQRLTDDLYGITNTMAWTDSGRFLTADTLTNQIYTYPIDPANQTLGNRLPFGIPFERGLPDGSCLDAEGYLWNCRVGGGSCLVRYAPDGQVDRVVELPCSWPTSCTFGGDHLDRLFVTSARFTMTPQHLARHPQEGCLWMVDVGVAGRPCHRFGQSANS